MSRKLTFSLDDDEQKKLDEWLAVVSKEVCEEQIKSFESSDDEMMKWKASQLKERYKKGIYQPYAGAIGGGMTYSFTPTGLGTIVTVKYFGRKIDLTNYDLW